jgi:hypothetical protein
VTGEMRATRDALADGWNGCRCEVGYVCEQHQRVLREVTLAENVIEAARALMPRYREGTIGHRYWEPLHEALAALDAKDGQT